jgi:protein TonB
MKFRTNIIFSFVMHLTIFTAALALAGKNAALHFPERFTMVRLLENTPVQKTAASGAEKKKRPSITAGNPVTRLREASPPIAPPTTQKQDKEPPTAVPQNNPFEDGVRLPDASSHGNATALQKGGVPGPSPGGMGLAMPGKSATQGSHEGGGKKAASVDRDVVNTIRAAIERAKSYPPLARKRGLEGTATTEFTINGKGSPENIRIVRSSGSDVLDNAAKNTVLRASPFPQVSGSVEVPITFRIEKRD